VKTAAAPDQEIRSVYWQIAVIACLAVTVYLATFSYEFVWDDRPQITQNPVIKDIHFLPKFFTSGVWGLINYDLAHSRPPSNYYRPLMYVSYLATYYMFGLNAGWFHFVNTLFHALTTIMVYLVALRFFRQPGLAFAAGLVFAVHPIHTEAVAWIACLPELSMAFFYLLSFYLYMGADTAPGRKHANWKLIASVLCFGLSLLSKEMAFTLPLILVGYEHFVLKRSLTDGFRRYVWYFVTAGVCFALRYYALSGFAPLQRFVDITGPELALSVFALIGRYWWKLFIPARLNAFYLFEPSRSVLDGEVLLALAIIAGLGWAAWKLWKKENRLWFSIAWVFVTLLPVLYLQGVGFNVFTARYLYLPSVGFSLIVAYAFQKLREAGPTARTSAVLGLSAFLALFSYQTVARAAVWKDSISLFSETLRVSPGAYLIHNELGVALAEKGKIAEAREHFASAGQLEPGYADAHDNLGGVYLTEKNLEGAAAEYRLALRTKSWDPGLHNKLGYVLYLNRKPDLALKELLESVRLKPEQSEAYLTLGAIYLEGGFLDRAIESYRKSVSIRPSAEGHTNLGTLYMKTNNLDAALKEFSEAARLQPNSSDMHYNLGTVYSRKGLLEEAVGEFRQAVSLNPSDTEAQASLKNAIDRKSSHR